MRVSVAICTRNRSRALTESLGALTRTVVPDSVALEVLVIDNASSDSTAQTIASFAERLPLRMAVERDVGLSHARNAAISMALGDYIIWIDDDALVDAHWLAAYAAAFREWPGAAFFGGPIEPLFEGTPASWLRDALPEVGNAYASLDLGRDAIALSRETLPFGANLAIRTTEQRRHAYDPTLGRRGDLLYAGEEWAVLEALLDAGESGRWVPGARVRHLIPPERQTREYLRRYYSGNGESHARVREASREPLLFGRPRWVWREALTQELAYQGSRLFASPRAWSGHLKRASLAWGMLRVPARGDGDQRSALLEDRG